tara:strand:- start:633 stop:1076 length:444 start_codon:yes stop_codon:yes gene_type:complete
MMIDYDIESIKLDEGFEPKPYKCTADKLTIGYGLNLEEGITKEEAEEILKLRLDANYKQLMCCEHGSVLDKIYYKKPYPHYCALINILSNMQYNLGLNGLLKFKNMWKAIEAHDFKAAALEMKDSKWYNQVGARAKRLVARMDALGN